MAGGVSDGVNQSRGTQKKLSLTWHTIIEPAPMATTVTARPRGSARPASSIIGAMIAAVTVMATVPDPWAIFSAAARKTASQRPRLATGAELLSCDDASLPHNAPDATTHCAGTHRLTASMSVRAVLESLLGRAASDQDDRRSAGQPCTQVCWPSGSPVPPNQGKQREQQPQKERNGRTATGGERSSE